MHWQRRLLIPALLAGLGLASVAAPAGAQPAPFSEDPPQYRSNRPYEAEVEREQRERDREAGVRDDAPLTVAGGIDFRDHYFFRGYNYVSSGLIAQPYVGAGYTVFKDKDLAVTPHAGAWLDITEQTAPDPPVHFHEFRGNAGVGVNLRNLLLDFQYVYYSSPGNAFDEVQEVGVDVTYDDSHCWRRNETIWSLNPSFSLYHQVKDDRDNDLNTFVGVGLEPTLRHFDVGPVPVTVSFPLTLGGSYDGYYKDADGHASNFGYWQGGVRVALPLGNALYGVRWALDAEVGYIRLMAKSARAANGFDSDDFVFRIGLAFR
jgi:hypothetical protein